MNQIGDVHTRIMKKNYKEVPQWWFHIILIAMVALALYACEGFDKQLQLPWWGILLACAIALFFTLPIGIIQATTNMVIYIYLIFTGNKFKTMILINKHITYSQIIILIISLKCLVQQPGLNVITELIIGYIYPGKPLANVAFKTYGYISMAQALSFVGDFKLGHYMKIPPRSMFTVQVKMIKITFVIFNTIQKMLLNSMKKGNCTE